MSAFRCDILLHLVYFKSIKNITNLLRRLAVSYQSIYNLSSLPPLVHNFRAPGSHSAPPTRRCPAAHGPGEVGTFSGTAQNILAFSIKCRRAGKLSERAATERIFLIWLYNCGTTSAVFLFPSDAASSNSRRNRLEQKNQKLCCLAA